MKRRNSESPISLFSFQDIIMSVVGIIILITLLLIIKLITQSVLAEPVTLSAVSIKELEKQIESLKSSLREIQDEITALHQAQQNSQALIPSPEQLDALQSTTERIETEIVAVETKINAAKEQNEKLKHDPKIQQLTETETTVKTLQEEIEKLKQENEKTKKEKDDLQAKVVPLREKNKDLDRDIAADVSMQLKVKVPVHQDKTAFILLYGNGVIDVLPTDGSATKSFTSRSDLDRWIRSRNKAKEYFVVYVRPSRFGEHEKIVQELKKQGFDVGLQVIGEKTNFEIQ
jgi:archaellum component FlaC